MCRMAAGPCAAPAVCVLLLSPARPPAQAATVEFDRLPLIANLPPLVLDCSRLTLLDLGRRDFMYSTNLPPAAQARRPSPGIRVLGFIVRISCTLLSSFSTDASPGCAESPCGACCASHTLLG